MKHFILLGAGFSRNWNGWLASEVMDYLLGSQEVRQNEYLKQLLWKHNQSGGGFETALAEVQAAWTQNYQQRYADAPHFSPELDNLQKFEAALSRMFSDMNTAYLKLSDFEFQNERQYMVRTFLTKFDAIFTLNQDLLLETHYLNDNVMLGSDGKWNGWQIPGMRPSAYLAGGTTQPVKKWVPETPDKFKVDDRLQPYFKLHGSSEWRSGGDKDLLVMGGNKNESILSHEILKWYYREFFNELTRTPCKLMIIGYGFRDEHINRALINAASKRQFEIFVIDPSGAEVISKTNRTFTRENNIYAANELENALLPIVIGASKRPLREIFGVNTYAEHSQVMRFFG